MIRAAGVANQLVHWTRNHQYCGRCGNVTEDKKGERAKICPQCGLINYPRLSPAIIVAVRKGEQILLAHSKRFPGKFYSVLAGFVEPGETLEQCVKREVREEVGIEVKNIRYFGSQPWPFPGFSHDCIYSRIRRWRNAGRRYRDCRRGLVYSGSPALHSTQNQHRPATDRLVFQRCASLIEPTLKIGLEVKRWAETKKWFNASGRSALNLSVSEAIRRMVIYHADRLHECVTNRRPNEVESAALQIFAHGIGLLCACRKFPHGLPGIPYGNPWTYCQR